MDFVCGYEIEFIGDQDREYLVEKLRYDLGLDIVLGKTDYNKWSWVKDPSLYRDRDENSVGHEIISPPMPLATSLEWLPRIFNWLDQNKCYTNESCGFHVNLSFADPDVIHKLDKLKLVCLLDEVKILQGLNRLENSYCNSWRQVIAHYLTYTDEFSNPDQTTNIQKLSMIIDDTKYRTVNFSKLASKYLEFRLLGGRDYHQNYPLIDNAIKHFCQVMEASINPELLTEQFIGEIPKLAVMMRK